MWLFYVKWSDTHYAYFLICIHHRMLTIPSQFYWHILRTYEHSFTWYIPLLLAYKGRKHIMNGNQLQKYLQLGCLITPVRRWNAQNLLNTSEGGREHLRLAKEGHGEDGNALQHACRSPKVHLIYPVTCNQVWHSFCHYLQTRILKGCKCKQTIALFTVLRSSHADCTGTVALLWNFIINESWF